MNAHIPTMFMMIIAASGTLALSVGWVARARDEDGLQLWTVALVLQTLVFSLFSLRNQIPDFFSILVANTLLSLSYSLLFAAIARFQQRHVSRLLLWGPPIVLVVALKLLMNEIGARIIAAGMVFITQYLVIFFSLLNGKYRVSGRGKYLLLVGFSIMISVMFIRTMSVIFALDSIASMLSSTPIQIVTYAMAFVTLILISIGFVLMVKERADERIRFVAMTDRLTGAWNRIRLEETAQQEIARFERYGRPVSLIMVDLDHFKQINDRFGHATGDLVLKKFCAVARGCIRNTDILGRWGGEEFLILLPDSGFASAAELAERVRRTVEQEEFADGLRVTASLGFAVCHSADTWGSWLERADQAMYRAKTEGRNRVEAECLEQHSDQNAWLDTQLVQLVWRRAYESGNGQIDTQHRALFEHVNSLLKAILNNRPKPEIKQQLGVLVTEIDQHFNDENAILMKSAYSDEEHHYELHAALMQKAIKLMRRFDEDKVGVGELFHYFAYDFVARHMLIEDRKFFPFLPPD